MRSRVEELDRQDETFAKFLVTSPSSSGSGEINEESFKVIGDHCGAMKARNVSEREELTAAARSLAQGRRRAHDRTTGPASGST